MKVPDATIPIRTYRFKYGVLHLEKAATVGMPDEEVAEQYADQGPLLEAWNDEMSATEFFDLPDLRDL